MEERLSEWLTSQIELFDTREGNTLSEADATARSLLQQIAEEQIEGREIFTDGFVERTLREFSGEYSEPLDVLLSKEPEIAEAEIDRVLTTRALDGMRGMVERVVRLSKLRAARIPSDQTAQYVREAARSYIYGLFQASAAMSRVALEQGLKDVLGSQGMEDFVPFKTLREQAERRGILDSQTSRATGDVARDASAVIHHRPTSSERALSILERSRGLIIQIYETAADLEP